MSSRAHRLVGVALALAATLTLVAGPVGAGEEPGVTVETVDISKFPEVILTVSPPPALAGVDVPPKAFKLTENGKARDVRVTRLGSSRLEVVVLMDTSGSMQGGPIIASKAAALSFVNRLPTDTNVAIVGFSDVPRVVAPFTTDRNAIAGAIESLNARGETALYDGVIAAVNLLATGAADQRSIVLLSDGGDTVSTAPIQQVVQRVADGNTGLTAIELKTGETDRTALDRITRAAAGRVIAVEDPQALDSAYTAIAERLSNLYELRFFSSGSTRADLSVSVSYKGVSSRVLTPVEFPDLPAASATTLPQVAAPKSYTEDGGIASGGVLLGVGVLFIVVAITLGVFVAIGDRAPQRRLADDYEAAGLDEEGVTWLTGVASRAAAFGENLANRGGHAETIDNRLDAAGLSMRAGELIAMVATAMVGGACFGFLLLGPIGFFFGAMVPLVAAPIVLASLRDRRRNQFADQLGDTLVLLSASLRAGYGLVQAVDAVARETDPPMSSEFGRVVVETRLGRDLNDALSAVVQRMGSEDFEWVVEAMQIHREVGGDLTEVLDHVGDTIRARTRIVRQVRALSAEGKISALVLFALPFAVGAVVSVSNPDYIKGLFDTVSGNLMLAFAAGLLVAGGLWLRKIVRPEF